MTTSAQHDELRTLTEELLSIGSHSGALESNPGMKEQVIRLISLLRCAMYPHIFGGVEDHTAIAVEYNLQQAQRLLSQSDVLLPKPRHYWIETNYSQYAHAHHARDLDATREILAERWPEYLPAFDAGMKRTWGHRFNMFIMKRSLADAYCAWLFDVLFELEKRLDICFSCRIVPDRCIGCTALEVHKSVGFLLCCISMHFARCPNI